MRPANGQSAVMANAAATLTPDDMTRLADHFAAMPGIGSVTPLGSTEAVRIDREGLPKLQLPACASCHAPGKPYPVLAGQRASYIAQRLRHWRGDETVVDARKSPCDDAGHRPSYSGGHDRPACTVSGRGAITAPAKAGAQCSWA